MQSFHSLVREGRLPMVAPASDYGMLVLFL